MTAVAQLSHVLAPLSQWLDDPEVEEVCINQPGEAYVWRHGFARHDVAMNADDLEDIAILAGAMRRQDVGEAKPLLATELPGGHRMQVVLPPCAPYPTIAIRKPSTFAPTLETLAGGGLFTATRGVRPGLTDADRQLVDLHKAGEWQAFLGAAVAARKNIVLCGATAAGKTTAAKALINSIPLDERLITIEDVPEWQSLPHPNRVALYYSKGKRSSTAIDAGDLVEAALRMRIGRLLMQELRDGAAFNFLRALKSGHPGAITTCHADHARGAFEAIGLMIKMHPEGGKMDDRDVQALLHELVHVVVHCQRDGGQFSISEVWFNLAEA